MCILIKILVSRVLCVCNCTLKFKFECILSLYVQSKPGHRADLYLIIMRVRRTICKIKSLKSEQTGAQFSSRTLDCFGIAIIVVTIVPQLCLYLSRKLESFGLLDLL